MTLLENKKMFLALVDEYAPDNTELTEDDDIPVKYKNLYGVAYQRLADMKTTLKTKNYSITATTGTTGYEEYSLPEYKQLKNVYVLDENNNKISGDYYFLGDKKIMISNSKTATYVVEYVPWLEIITEDTDDDFELEIDQDLQTVLPYIVAADLLKTDPSANYVAFEKEYMSMMQNITTSKKGISINITEGEL